LERKDFESAKLYLQVKRYEAAIVAFENFRKDFPGSKFQEETMFLAIKTAYEYSKVSIVSRQEERYQDTVDKYIVFVDKYPNSPYLKEAEPIYANSTEVLTKFASRNKE
jgi:outer membrane protein assembly factor BamD